MFKAKLLASGVLAVLLGAGLTRISYSMITGAPVNVLDKGADKTGGVDSTVAFNLALASGTRVVVPPGTYNFNTTLQFAAGTVVDCGAPSVVSLNFNGGAPDSSNAAIRLNGQGAAILNCSINVTAGDYRRTVDMRASYTYARGNKINVTSPNISAAALGYVFFAAQGVDMTNIVIEHNDIQGSANLGDGVQASHVPGIRVLNNRIHDYTTSQVLLGDNKFIWGIYIADNAPGALIQGNTVQNTNTSGIHKNGNTNSDSPGVRVVYNYIDSVACVGIAVNLASGAVVAGNWVSRADLPMSTIASPYVKIVHNHLEQVVTRAAGAINANKPLLELDVNSNDTVIADNTFGSAGDGQMGIDNSAAAVDVTISANRFLATSPALPIDSVGARTNVTGNSIAFAAASVQYVWLQGADSTFSSNTLVNPANAFGIRMSGNSGVVEGNRIIGGKDAVFISAGTGTRVSENIFTGQTVGVISDGGTATYKRGNRFSLGAVRGTAVLVAGTVTVNTVEVLTGDVVTFSHTVTGGTVGTLTLGTIVNATSFVINSSNAADTSTVAWEIIH